ncbi:MAG TPA: ABC transporter substrate-binding protein [Chloroflexota bacterium]|jgi:peptide/nickel transport system substrate-binding protein|nr:ABC transporter substrate-binding protein [Chloroflexota bacterium]
MINQQHPHLRRTAHRTSAILLALVMATVSVSTAMARPATGPTHGGTLTFAFGQQPDCLDSSKSFELQALSWAAVMTDNLVSEDAKGKFIPDLATSWSYSHHGLWLTFNLRHGVTFTDGAPMNAAAIAANLRRPDNSFALGPMSSVNVNNNYKVTMVFTATFRPILHNLAFLVPIYDPKTDGGNDCESTSLAGTGPFKVSAIGPGLSSMSFSSYAGRHFKLSYGHNSGPAYLSNLDISTVTDPTQAVSELLSQQVDVAGIAPSQLPRVKGNKSITVNKSLSQSAWWIEFNCKHKPFNNRAVRWAISEAVSRAAVIRAGLSGYGQPLYNIVPPDEPYSDPSAKAYAASYNVKAAKKIFAKYHVKGPFTLLGFNGSYAPAAEAIGASLQAAGLKIKIVTKDIPDTLAQAQAGAFDLLLNGYGANDPDFLYVQFDSATATGPFATNTTFYKSKALDKLIVRGRETVNVKAARRAYYAAEKFIVNTAAIADPIYDPISLVGLDSRVGGYHRNVFNLYPVWQDLYVK